jgi:hypothetical protein
MGITAPHGPCHSERLSRGSRGPYSYFFIDGFDPFRMDFERGLVGGGRKTLQRNDPDGIKTGLVGSGVLIGPGLRPTAAPPRGRPRNRPLETPVPCYGGRYGSSRFGPGIGRTTCKSEGAAARPTGGKRGSAVPLNPISCGRPPGREACFESANFSAKGVATSCRRPSNPISLQAPAQMQPRPVEHHP